MQSICNNYVVVLREGQRKENIHRLILKNLRKKYISNFQKQQIMQKYYLNHNFFSHCKMITLNRFFDREDFRHKKLEERLGSAS